MKGSKESKLYPVTVIKAKYGDDWVALNLESTSGTIKKITGSEAECASALTDLKKSLVINEQGKNVIVGRGEDPREAYLNLLYQMLQAKEGRQ